MNKHWDKHQADNENEIRKTCFRSRGSHCEWLKRITISFSKNIICQGALLCILYAAPLMLIIISTPQNVFSQTAISSKSVSENKVAKDYLKAMIRFEPWAESIWKDYPAIPGSGYFGDGGSEGNGGIRGITGIALSYAVLVRALPDAPERKHRLQRVEQALKYAEETHQSGPVGVVTVDGKKWGANPANSPLDDNGSITSMWAGSLGAAAALLEKELDPKVVEGCKRVVAAEADWISRIPPQSGYKLDTKSEENAWQSTIVTLAAAWMTDDARAPKWKDVAKLYMANTYTVPADSSGPFGKLVMTQNMFPSYGIENHGFFHPSYQIAGAQSLGDFHTLIRIINPAFAKEIRPLVEHNQRQVWDLVKGIILDCGELAFPSGLDWSLHQFEHVNYLAWMAAYFKMPEAQWAEPLLAKQILHRQEVNGDGRFVGESCRKGAGKGSTDGFYVEAVQVLMIAMAYLHNELSGFPEIKGKPPAKGIMHYPDIGLIIQRSGNAFTTVSYGAKTMSLVYPLNGKTFSQQLFVSPNMSSMIGSDGKTTLKSFVKTQRGFRAELNLNGIKSGRRSRMIIISEPDAVVYVEVPATDSLKEWLLAAVENHPLTGGERKVFWKGNSQSFAERSGAISQPINSGWINVDDWIGWIGTPDGWFDYRAAKDYNRVGAAEDSVVFEPNHKAAPRAVIVLPGTSAAETASVQKSVKWKVSKSECRLSFKIREGKRKEISISLKEK